MVVKYETEIEMLLFDQEKIVSYKELSNRLGITPKEAQESLANFIESKRKLGEKDKKSEFYVTYLLVIEDKNNKSTKVILANEQDLCKREKEGTVVSKQVYSIGNKHIEDFNLIYSSDLDSSHNISRKSNLSIVFKENEHSADSVLGETFNSDKSANEQTNNQALKIKSENVLESKKVNKVTIEVKEERTVQKEGVKPQDVKVSEEVENKKAKMTVSDVEKTKKSPIKKSAPAQVKKVDVKTKPAQQASITNFFKKT